MYRALSSACILVYRHFRVICFATLSAAALFLSIYIYEKKEDHFLSEIMAMIAT